MNGQFSNHCFLNTFVHFYYSLSFHYFIKKRMTKPKFIVTSSIELKYLPPVVFECFVIVNSFDCQYKVSITIEENP